MEDGQTCDHTNLQAALNAAQNGDTVLLKSGDTFAGSFRLTGGKSDITIKSSLADELPQGYRIERNSHRLARISANKGEPPLTIGGDALDATVEVGGPGVTVSPSSAAAGINIGDSVAMLGTSFSPYYCLAVDNPFKASCTADRVGKFVWRGSTRLANGDVLYAHGLVLPAPLMPDTPYYVVNAETTATGGNNANSDKWQLSTTPGGPPIELVDWPAQNGLTFNASPWPARNNQALYVIAKTGTKLTLSATPDGPPITWESRGNYYTGGNPVRAAGTKLYVVKPVRNITLKGLEITESSINDPYILLYLTESAHTAGEHDGITVQHCWIHGDDDATSLPHQGILAHARNLVVRDSIVEEIHSSYADTQAIGSSNSSGGWLIENNTLSATGEIIMVGGAYPIIFPNVPTGITIRRNLFTKPSRWWHTIGFSKVDNQTVRIKRAYSPSNCDTDARAVAYNQCFWHDANGIRNIIDRDGLITFANLPASGKMVVYGTTEGLKGVHNLGPTVTCPEYLQCSEGTDPSFPRLSTPLGTITIANGIVAAQGSHVWSVKNHLEIKLGRTITVEGNVFEFAPAMGQDSLFVFNTQAASTDTEPINYMTEATDYVVQNNIFRYAEKAVTSSGRSYAPSGSTRHEMSGFGRSGMGIFRNNLFYSMNGDKWGGSSGEGWHVAGNADHYTFDHNTVVDVGYVTRHSATNPDLAYTNNIFIPWLKTAYVPATGGDSSVDWMGLIANNRVPNGVFSQNVLMNRNSIANRTMRGSNYPDNTYLVQTNDPGRNPEELFMKWVEGDYAASDYRVKPEAAALYATSDGRAIGADIDEIESQTGRNGAYIMVGVPALAERSARRIEASETSMVLSYVPLTESPCKVQLWNTNTYAGAPIVDTTDAGATFIDGRRNVRLPDLPVGTMYYGKRWCDTEVDVFWFYMQNTGVAIQVHADAMPGSVEALVEYGASSSLGFSASVTNCEAGCMLTVPADAAYYRVAYRSPLGIITTRSHIGPRPAQ